MGILKDTDVIYAILINLKSGCLQFNLTSSQWSHILILMYCYDFILHAVAHIASLPWKISLVLYSSTGWQLTMSHGCCKVHRCLLKVCKNQYRHNYVMGQNHPGFLFRNSQTCVLRNFFTQNITISDWLYIWTYMLLMYYPGSCDYITCGSRYVSKLTTLTAW